MARKTFISYKYSEAKGLRDDILKELGDDAQYYKGETSESPDLTDETTEKIKEHLKDMIYDTSVTIVIISPNMKNSNWIEWEISYSLKEVSRKGRTSKTNGIVGVIQKINGSYDWLLSESTNCHGKGVIYTKLDLLPYLIQENKYNSNPPIWCCEECRTYDWLDGSYINLVKEDTFLADPITYIENAFEKKDKINLYDITKAQLTNS